MGELPTEASTETGFTLTRTRDGCGVFRNLQVYVDDEEIGKLPYAAISFFPTASGGHHIRVRMDWCWSNSFLIDVEPNTIEHLECGTRYQGWKAFANFYQMIIHPEALFYMRSLKDDEKRTRPTAV